MKTALPLVVTSIPATREIKRRPDPVRPEPPSPDGLETVVHVSHYLWLLRKAWWKIALFTLLVTGVAALIAFRLKPLYESTARVAIDLNLPTAVMAQTVPNGASGGEADQVFITQLQLIQSDAVLRPVATRLGLLIRDAGPLPAGMSASDIPVTLKHLTVTHPPNSFLINISYRSPNPVEAAAVANAVSRSFILHNREMRAQSSLDESAFMEKQIDELKKNMDDSALALASYEKQLGVINSDEKNSILSARMQQLNTEYTVAQSDRMVKQVDMKALETGSVAALEVSPQATALTRIEDNLHAAQEKMEAAHTIYGSGNPEYKRAASALAELERQQKAMREEIAKRVQVEYAKASHHEMLIHATLLASKAESDSLNAHSLQYQQLKREAEANKNLYAELFRKVKEAGINAAFQGSAIRIADEARPQLHPVFPNKVVFIGLGFLFSLMGSSMVVLLLDMTDKTLRDPMQTRREIGLDVLGILPRVRRPRELSLTKSGEPEAPRPSKTGGLIKPDQWFGSVDFYEEAISALLSTVRISQFDLPLRTVLVTSAMQGEGKSCCIGHMAAAHARQGHRTLLIDADLRCPTQHDVFGLSAGPGLADAVAGRKKLSEIRQRVAGNELLDVVTAGDRGSAATERIGKAVEALLVEAGREYDMIFLDAPPMLCFAESIQLASLADGVLVICRAGETSQQAVAGVLSTLDRLGATTLGLVLNQVQQTMSSHYGPYRNYYRSNLKPRNMRHANAA